MKTLNYILQGFGFINYADFKTSSFGFMSDKIINLAAIGAVITSITTEIFGITPFFSIAYVVLIIFEWQTGLRASLKRGEKHESRKLGRMILKVATYTIPVYVLNTFQKEVVFPSVLGYEIDPFVWLYWTVLLVIIWQLLVSLLENLDALGYRYASTLLKIINKQFYKHFDIHEDQRN
ncbi:phage holin family protein [Aquimarina latercula]|uniref:phage holin family protein n=1 Tax=Aquimarina latercula TaxID=987 RepID=UPI0004293CB4|nr:phage holin family protein [Aquimarina latercula]